MAAVKCLLSEEQFLCSICLQIFTQPVSIPCGHNFCKSCITQHWVNSDHCQCPLCSKNFNTLPELHVNTLFSEIISQIKNPSQKEADLTLESSEQHLSKPEEVSCDVCTEPKLTALRSCLVCLASYCETHLEPHLTVSALKIHQLTEPVENLKDRMCPKHNKPLEFFCRPEQTCICTICSLQEHKYHDVVLLKEEYEKQKGSLQQIEAETQEMVEERWMKIQEVQRSVELSQEAADKEIAKGLQSFSGLIHCVQRGQDQFVEGVLEKQRWTQKQAQICVQELEQEISELEKRSTEVERLSRSEDHLHFLQSSASLKAPPGLKNWSTESSEPASFEGSAARALSELQKSLTEEFNELFKVEQRRVEKFAVDVTLDKDTANPYLVVSQDLKQVHCSDMRKVLTDKTQWFSDHFNVLGKESFSSGKFYFEVQVKGKSDWSLGAVNKSINREDNITFIPQNGQWCICLRNRKECRALSDIYSYLHLKSTPNKVGVYVDYSGRVVSFHDVDTAALIHTFTNCNFKESVLPYFSPGLNFGGTNSIPLIITEPGVFSYTSSFSSLSSIDDV